MKQLRLSLVAGVIVSLVLVARSPSAPPPAPTAAPKAPAPAAPPTPTAAPKAPEPTKPAAQVQPTAAPQPRAAPATKAAWPEKGKRITLIVAFAAGGSTDLLARIIAPFMEKELGVPVQVVNRPGASTQVGTTELARSKPDGYTLGFIALSSAATVYLDPERKAAYGRKDFQPIANIETEDMAVSVQAGSPLKTLKDMVDAAKAKPDSVKVGDSGYMTIVHLAGVSLGQAAGVKFAFVHFQGNAPATTALLGGHVDGIVTGSAVVASHVKDGAMRMLAILNKSRSPFFPDVPSSVELGYQVISPATVGLAAPTGTPKEAIETLATVVKKATEDAQFQTKLKALSQTPLYMGPADFAAWWDQVDAATKPLIDLVKAEAKK